MNSSTGEEQFTSLDDGGLLQHSTPGALEEPLPHCRRRRRTLLLIHGTGKSEETRGQHYWKFRRGLGIGGSEEAVDVGRGGGFWPAGG
ncbi:unnamed protein product [Linum trigynum]|uniref:Uncharacterized protein n=1 Tax=Linum trigynum TaxID=586398 RepID=A0AAV2FKQ9_9ROSI